MKSEVQKIIVDCDAGTDDAVALIMLLEAHKLKKLEIKAITCLTGNTFVDNVVYNVFRTLNVCEVNDIPVFKGAYSSLLSTENAKITGETYFHGVDGFGDVYKDKPNIDKLEKEHAVVALNRIVSQNPGEINLVCLGPLTNVALAIKMYSNFVNCVKKFFVMGGNYTAMGNVTSQAEFNFFADPESVHILLCSAKNIWLLPWETCFLKSKVTHEWRENVFGVINTPAVKLINDIEGGTYADESKKLPYYLPCDGVLGAIILRPDMATEVSLHNIDIELSGAKTRGQALIDHLFGTEPNVHLITDVDTEIFQKVLLFAANPKQYHSVVFS